MVAKSITETFIGCSATTWVFCCNTITWQGRFGSWLDYAVQRKVASGSEHGLHSPRQGPFFVGVWTEVHWFRPPPCAATTNLLRLASNQGVVSPGKVTRRVVTSSSSFHFVRGPGSDPGNHHISQQLCLLPAGQFGRRFELQRRGSQHTEEFQLSGIRIHYEKQRWLRFPDNQHQDASISGALDRFFP